MKIRRLLSLGVLALATFVVGCASTGPATTPASPSAPATPAASAPRPAAGQVRVPTLVVKTDCGTCEVGDGIRGYITDAYARLAGEDGAQISSAEVATLTIKSYTARSNAARFMVGAFAGKDEIKAVIAYRGKSYEVEDYYRNAWQGIAQVAENIGELAYAQLKTAP